MNYLNEFYTGPHGDENTAIVVITALILGIPILIYTGDVMVAVITGAVIALNIIVRVVLNIKENKPYKKGKSNNKIDG